MLGERVVRPLGDDSSEKCDDREPVRSCRAPATGCLLVDPSSSTWATTCLASSTAQKCGSALTRAWWTCRRGGREEDAEISTATGKRWPGRTTKGRTLPRPGEMRSEMKAVPIWRCIASGSLCVTASMAASFTSAVEYTGRVVADDQRRTTTAEFWKGRPKRDALGTPMSTSSLSGTLPSLSMPIAHTCVFFLRPPDRVCARGREESQPGPLSHTRAASA